VTVAKLEEIFKIAGNVIEVDLKTDKDGKSRGMGTVRFEHPVEAVQAIGLFSHTHSRYFCSASSSPILLRGAPDYKVDAVSELTF